MLMHFLEPRKFSSQEEFETQFSDLGHEEQVGRQQGGRRAAGLLNLRSDKYCGKTV
jgi:hypothetical protein